MGRSIPAVQQLGAPSHQLRLIMAKKKGFMTPERKKKLRTLLRKKAAEELKKEQERPPRDKGSFQRGAESRKTLRTLLMMSSRRLSRSTSTNGSILKVRCSSFNVRSFCVTSKSTS